MSTADPEAGAPTGPPAETADPPAGQSPTKRRNRWIWVSALLAVIAVGLLVWGLATQSDLDGAQQDLAAAQKELDSANQQLESANQELASTRQSVEELEAQADDGPGAGGVVVAAGALYTQFAEQLDATEEDLAATQKELEEAQQAAAQADKDAEAAQQKAADAGSETEKAQAQAEQAAAEAEAAESRAAVATSCAKAFIGAFGSLFEGDSVEDQVPVVRKQLEAVAADCQEQMAG